jgi:hypothetical protein
MLLSWFDAREASKFGTTLAEMLIERTPAEGKHGKRMVAKKHEAMLHQLEQHVTRFGTEHKLTPTRKRSLATASSGRCATRATTPSTSTS